MSDTDTTKDLENIRDEKCFPLIEAIFKEFPNGLIVEPDKAKELQMKCLSVMLDADLNVGQEVSYVSQLILGVLSGLNQTVQLCELSNDDEHYHVIARDMLQIIVDEFKGITLGSVTPDITVKDFSGAKEKLMDLFQKERLSQLEVKYIMEIIFNNFTTLNNALSSSITNSTERMEAKILGIESMADLTLKKLNEELIK